MKIEIKETKEVKKFKPITVELTFETVEEARLFFHITNAQELDKIILNAPHMSGWKGQIMADELGGTNAYPLIKKAIKDQGFDI